MEPTVSKENASKSDTVLNAKNTKDDCETVESLTKNGMQSLMELIKASNNVPIDQLDFWKTSTELKSAIENESEKILKVLGDLLQHQQILGNIARRDNDEKYELIIEANDGILERVDNNLDELQGLKKNPEPVVGDLKTGNKRTYFFLHNNAPRFLNNTISLTTTRLNARPQIKFKDKIDNRSIPFEPRIKEKPNALKQLSILLEIDDERGECYSHPYEYELTLFKPSKEQLQHCNPQKPKPLSETSLTFVNDLDTLNAMMDHLKQHKEIAVDLEHHSYRSFQGFTCLVQISTRENDYLVDALELRHELHVLNEVFTDPKVVKVFHGADHDVEWLQRDLSVYVVNMFDTHQAAQFLNYPRLSLAYLLKHFCNIDCNKQFQLYDWRTRPLSEAAITYAREDTHYLLYVYDKLKNSLIETCQNKTSFLEAVIHRSTEICKARYWKCLLTDDSHMEFYRKSRKMFDNRQMYAMKHLYEWRDKIAREEDESVSYVLPNHMLMNIAESLPRELQGISALCNPVPPLVKQHERDLHKIVLKAKEQPLVKPVSTESESLHQSFQDVNWVPVNVDSKLYCPHDLSHSDDFREMPTLLQKNLSIASSDSIKDNKFITDVSVIPVLEVCEEDIDLGWADLLRGKDRQWKFVSPYQRYQKVIAFVNAEEQRIIEQDVSMDETPSSNIKNEAEQEVPSISLNPVNNDVKQEMNNTIVNETPTTDPINAKHEVKTDAQPHVTNSYKPDSVPADSIVQTSKDVDKEVVHVIIDDDTHDVNIVEEVTNDSKGRKRKSDCDKSKPNDNQKKAKSDESFQPFNYNSVDFSKFQSNTQTSVPNSSNTQKGKGRRTPWLGGMKKKDKKVS